MTAFFTAIGNWESMQLGGVVAGNVTFTPNVTVATVSGEPSHAVLGTPIPAVISNGQLSLAGGAPVQLLANTADLGLSTALTYTLRFTNITVGGQPTALPGYAISAPPVGNVTFDVIAGTIVVNDIALTLMGLAGINGIPARSKARSLVFGLMSA